ncbi:hypothetical protein QN345_01195 [Cryobacterium sp. 10I1]|uniref:hypothetical protein n=1 Tax=unclassified Cryobacterium TaxID=2649013 RepID=UPI002B2312AD|nr:MULTISPECIES: hypothetical protein [unclassified Cryobacterium]MEB0001336.1 hypothetical protein [Cryobacterium sp. RTC2.1]MEB0303950.1 hypothetical protein [Cryobacterium sp. 10I1]
MLDKARRMLTALVVVGLIGTVLTAMPQPAQALSGSQFDPGYIISDQNFYVRDAMSQDQIQAFLDAKVGTCQNSLCLNVLRVDTPTTTLSFGTCATYSGEAGESAARIIYKVQQACTISAKVLLVTLQKEQGLVTDNAPSASELRNALGQGCPDTAPCDSAYYGFFIQVFSAARQFAWYGNPLGSHTSLHVGQMSNIQYHPNTACGSSPIQIKNNATAALYYYTPYQPDAAALANLGGTGDSCSSYGNRNFWVYYNNWFGSPNSAGNPVASVDILTTVPGGIRVAGWAFDPDTSDSIQVHVYVNGVGTAIVASNNRPDVGAMWPSAGSAHGFDVTLKTTTAGNQHVCVFGINQGPGTNTLFTCSDLVAQVGSPQGVLDSVSASRGAITVTGWTFDPDTSASIPVHIYVDSAGAAFVADDSRSDVAQIYPGYGPQHGYSRSLTVAPGVHTVCAFGIESAGIGSNTLLGCKTVTVLSGAPVGTLDVVSVGPGTITAAGWAFDPDTTASIPVHVYSDSSGVAGSATGSRPDVAAAYPGYGSSHGYAITFAATPGVHRVCSYGIDVVSPGGNQELGCKTVTAMSGSPVGVIDSLSATNGKLSVSGWAYDPDTAQPIPVHIYVDASGTPITAPNERLDFAAVYPAYGPNHGYGFTTAITLGSHNVCVYAINVGPGSNALLGCKVVTG